HLRDDDSDTFDITKASSTVTLSCPATVVITGSPLQPCTATPVGAGVFTATPNVSYSNNIFLGTATVTASYPGDDNHDASASVDASFDIVPPAWSPPETTTTVPGAGPGDTDELVDVTPPGLPPGSPMVFVDPADAGNVTVTVTPIEAPTGDDAPPFATAGAIFFDVDVTGNTGPVAVCFPGSWPENQLWHLGDTGWVDVSDETLSLDKGMICGWVETFSPFAVTSSAPAPSPTTVPTASPTTVPGSLAKTGNSGLAVLLMTASLLMVAGYAMTRLRRYHL
ncbi:MAG TPA: hypothetical protein VIS05_03955, partial [Ilumatobacter sp.]